MLKKKLALVLAMATAVMAAARVFHARRVRVMPPVCRATDNFERPPNTFYRRVTRASHKRLELYVDLR